jgi:hypothetical protein
MGAHKSIRDPIYNYIYLTPLEMALVSQPIFQRLRFIRQNSAAYLTYPSNNSNRFCHSLGVMHLGGQMFKRALENSSADILRPFLDECRRTLVSTISDRLQAYGSGKHEKAVASWRGKLGNACGFGHRPIKGEIISLNDKAEHPDIFIINVLWQSVRLACLMHDLGHMPFSHLFETALRGYASCPPNQRPRDLKSEFDKSFQVWYAKINTRWRDLGINFIGIPMHEQIGSWLIDDVIRYDNIDPDLANLANICNPLAELIFLLNRPEERRKIGESEYAVLRCLHTIISSDLDADRLDYCVRDPHNSGLEFGAIDVTRIVDSLKLLQVGGMFRIYPSVKAIPGLESFYHQRYLVYKYAIYHHNVSRMDALLEYIVGSLLDIASSKSPEKTLLGVLKKHRFVDENVTCLELLRPDQMCYYDDEWLRTMLMDIHRSCGKLSAPERKIEVLLLAIETFLFAQTNNLISLWKRESAYDAMLTKVLSDATSGLSWDDAHRKLRKAFDSEIGWREDFLVPLKEKIECEGVTLLYSAAEPKIFGVYKDTGEGTHGVVTEGDSVTAITSLSPYVKSLKSAADRNQFFHLFLLAKGINSKAIPKTELVERCRAITISALRDALNRGGSGHVREV